jgi:hypothetical protein
VKVDSSPSFSEEVEFTSMSRYVFLAWYLVVGEDLSSK